MGVAVALMAWEVMVGKGMRGKGFRVVHLYEDHLWWVGGREERGRVGAREEGKKGRRTGRREKGGKESGEEDREEDGGREERMCRVRHSLCRESTPSFILHCVNQPLSGCNSDSAWVCCRVHVIFGYTRYTFVHGIL